MSIDDTFQDPDYHPPVIINRQPTLIPRIMSEQGDPTIRYSSGIHKQPQRFYTVNAITVKQSDDCVKKMLSKHYLKRKKTNENKKKEKTILKQIAM